MVCCKKEWHDFFEGRPTTTTGGIYSSSSVRIYHFFDRFIYSDPPDCLDSSVHSVSKSQNAWHFSEDPIVYYAT